MHDLNRSEDLDRFNGNEIVRVIMGGDAHEEATYLIVVLSITTMTGERGDYYSPQGRCNFPLCRPPVRYGVALLHRRFIGLQGEIRLVALVGWVFFVLVDIGLDEVGIEWPRVRPPEVVAVVTQYEPLRRETLLEGVVDATARGEATLDVIE